ncbi:hypothetical protein B7494_g635 [Chlorociboria aeruginascens]|nr:hypothetical protein B7494_g635 [Chlorociboria aeruginascens]
MEGDAGERSRKRQKLGNEDDSKTNGKTLESLEKEISPPPLRRSQGKRSPGIVKSPFQLTTIHDLPASSNVDAVSLKDLLGDPLIAECWEFNYLHDLDFLMDAFDEDIRGIVNVHVVHGFWKQEDQSRQNLITQAAKYPNITLHTAYMPEMFGTHHTKMLILFRHDATAQVIIHTANMIAFDWTNMSQAVWRSPFLPMIVPGQSQPPQPKCIGSGSKFKIDLLNYLRAYDTKRTVCKPLFEQLFKYDFSEIRAALVSSVPGKHGIGTSSETAWGWAGLKNALKSIAMGDSQSEVVVQVSSIATLGVNDKWLDKTFFRAINTSQTVSPLSKFRIIFPTADEIRRSLNGYKSGSAIHTKIQSPAQQKQLLYLKPILYHWAGDGAQHSSGSSAHISDAGRKRAAPHIKTYIRFANSERSAIDWALVTSANLSRQAWGEAMNAAGEIRICSYEIGVLVWPELFGEKATMVPTFKSDTPPLGSVDDNEMVVGLRMPYDLPLVQYGKDDVPWCASSSYNEPDWTGQTYNVPE